MKLAEALILRADAQKRIAQLRTRLVNSAKVQEGEQPPENPEELLEELDRVVIELTDLIKRINKTNASTPFDGDMTLTDALAERDALATRRSVLSGIVHVGSERVPRYMRSELRTVVTVDIAAIQKQMDDFARQYRELDTRIQEMNWQVDLVEA